MDSKGIHNFFATIEPNYSANIFKEEDGNKYYLEVVFEMFGKIKDKINISRGIHRDKHVLTIEGEVEDANNIKNAQGILKYTKFFFQIVFHKFHEIEDSKSKNKIKYNLAKILENENKINKDEELGIYQIIFPIKFIKMN